MHLELGAPLRCTDGVFGELADIVVDPASRTVTHLVARPQGLDGVERLVPVGLAQRLQDGEGDITLGCSLADVQKLDYVQDYANLRGAALPTDDPDWDVGLETVLPTPNSGVGMLGDSSAAFDAAGMLYDRVPKGEVELARTSAVLAPNGGYLGRVDGLDVGAGGEITQFVLERGHFWRRRAIAVPIAAIARLENDAVTLNLGEKELDALPSVRIGGWF
jgi:hypothetical protein